MSTPGALLAACGSLLYGSSEFVLFRIRPSLRSSVLLVILEDVREIFSGGKKLGTAEALRGSLFKLISILGPTSVTPRLSIRSIQRLILRSHCTKH